MQWLLNVQNQNSCIHIADIISSFSFFMFGSDNIIFLIFGPKHRLWSRLGEAVLKCTHDL